MDYKYRLTTLRNGIRIASVEMPHMQSVSAGIWAGIGGRYESRKTSGISHFLEHLLFKGTEKRTARQIIEAIEGVGGYLNAFTTEDHTCFYAKAAGRHLEGMCDVLCDMYLNSRFAAEEIEREREVIREEILMYRDHPAQHAQELLSETMWPEHPLGRPLTGTVETIGTFRRPQLMRFMKDHYNGRTTVVTVAGDVPHEKVVALFRGWLDDLGRGKAPRFHPCSASEGETKVSLATQETEQTHLAMGFYGLGRSDDRRFALKLLSVILGENMSSRLFQTLRERYGFCYSVQSGMVTLADAGMINIYAGLDTAKLELAIKVILRELKNLCEKRTTLRELQKAKDYTVGQTLMGLESTSNHMMWLGESILGYRKILDPAEIESKVRAVTPDDIRNVACFCLNRAKLGVAVVGPVKDRDQIKGWLN